MAAAARTTEEWRQVVNAWRASGRSATVFGRERGVHARTLRWWAWRLGSVATKPVSAAFAEVVLAEPSSLIVPDFVVEVDGARIRVSPGFDAGELRRLVAALC